MGLYFITRTGDERRQANAEARDALSAERHLLTLVSGVEYALTVFDERLENALFLKDYLQVLRAEDPLSTGVFRRRARETHRFGLGDSLRFGLADCIECGCCDYVCPSAIPLVERFRQARIAMRERASQKARAQEARLNFEHRERRLAEREADRRREFEDARRRARDHSSDGNS